MQIPILQVALNKLEEHNVTLVLQQVSASAYDAAAEAASAASAAASNATASVYEVCGVPSSDYMQQRCGAFVPTLTISLFSRIFFSSRGPLFTFILPGHYFWLHVTISDFPFNLEYCRQHRNNSKTTANRDKSIGKRGTRQCGRRR